MQNLDTREKSLTHAASLWGKNMKKYMEIIKIKSEHAKEYIELHNHPWPEMLQAELEADMKKEVIFFYDNMSIIYSECEDYEACDKKLRSTEVCQRWDALVKPWMEGSIMPPKVFDLTQQAEGELLLD